VSFTAQYRMVYADRRLALEAGMDASIGSTTPSGIYDRPLQTELSSAAGPDAVWLTSSWPPPST